MNEITTLLLAWRMAQAYKKDESKAIYLCAGKLWKQIEDETIRSLVVQLAKRDTSDYQRIEFLKRLEFGLKKENLI